MACTTRQCEALVAELGEACEDAIWNDSRLQDELQTQQNIIE